MAIKKKLTNYNVQILIPILVILVASLIFALRYIPAFSIPNFYAEDGKVFTDVVLQHNPLEALFTWFNGYLIVGQYVLVELAVGAYKLFGMSFSDLPLVLAAVSCLFLGFTAALPYLLFKKQLGAKLSLLAVLFGAFVPIPSFDYAIIGTIGNLKFLFLYWAFLFCLYRNLHATNEKKTIFADSILLLCVLTYAPSMALFPFLLWPYRDEIKKAFKTKSLKPFLQPSIISLFVLCLIAFLYVVVVLVKGIPPIPGYLDTAYDIRATPKIAFRVTWYQWLANIAPTMRDSAVIGLLLLLSIVALRVQKSRFVFIFGMWAIFASTISFVVNRPGISEYFLYYGPNPDQFFYGQTLVFMFVCAWLIKDWFNRLKVVDLLLVLMGIALFMWWSINATGSFGKNRVIYERLGTAESNIEKACNKAKDQKVSIQSYPTEEWKWKIDRSIVCGR